MIECLVLLLATLYVLLVLAALLRRWRRSRRPALKVCLGQTATLMMPIMMLAMTIQTVDLAQTPTKELASTIYFILTYCSHRQYTEWMKENLPRTSEEQIDLANALSLIWLWSFRIHMLGGAYILWA